MLVHTEICHADLFWSSCGNISSTEYFLFATTSLNLRKAFKNSVNPNEDHHFSIYVRLFIIMGITWIFGFISAFADEFVVDLIFVILNALQGLFLFIAFVCRRSVRVEIKKWRQKSKEKKKMNLKQQTSTGSGTGSYTGSTALSVTGSTVLSGSPFGS